MDLTNRTIVFSTTNCPYCVKAMGLLDEKGIEYDVVKVKVDMSKEEMQSIVQQRTGVLVDTVPQIFIGGDYIGGSDDLEAHFAKDEADSLEAGDLSDFDI